MSVSYFDCYKFLVIPLWVLGWNPYKIRVRLQKIISTTCFIIHLTANIICLIISFNQHYDSVRDAFLVILFGSNMITCLGKHFSILFCSQSFETVVDFFNDYLTPEEEEYQTVIKNKTKPVLKVMYAFVGITSSIAALLIFLPIIQKYCFGVNESIFPVFRANFVNRSLTISLTTLAATMYNCLFISLCDFINAHIDVLICQICHIEYERGFDKSELRKSLKMAMQRHATILMANGLRCKAFYWLVFLQLSGSTACLCFALLHLEDTSTLIALPYEFIEICLFCYFGQTVENKSEEIAFAFYSTPWPEMDPLDRKLVLVALHNSQKTLKSYGGPFHTLSHETLKSVLQSAYSYYAVLNEIK